jgi:peptidoglycan/xylan/chitin deacetylase (PgdA/CDA1 family)
MKRLAKAVYDASCKHLPMPARKAVTYLEYKAGSVPRIYHDPRFHPVARLARGSLTISVDFELSWGWQYARNQCESAVAKGLRERKQVLNILEQLERHQVSATWATVGHLFLNKCQRSPNGLAHGDMPRLMPFETNVWKFSHGDWYQFDPCSDVKRDPSWYAPDLVERILSSSVKHEIACHGFSHAGFGEYCSKEVAAAEVDACKEAMSSFGLKPKTWVFPGNDEGFFSILADKGIRIVRAFPKALVNISLPLQRDDGMWAVHVSTGLSRGKHWTIDQRLARLKRFVDAAASSKLAAHLWFHPSMPSAELSSLLCPFLVYCAEQRDKGMVDIFTMDQLVVSTEIALNSQRKTR